MSQETSKRPIDLGDVLLLTFFPSDSSPVNSFPRNTTDTTLDVQWVFDTQSAGWEVVFSFRQSNRSLMKIYFKSNGSGAPRVHKSMIFRAAMQSRCPIRIWRTSNSKFSNACSWSYCAAGYCRWTQCTGIGRSRCSSWNFFLTKILILWSLWLYDSDTFQYVRRESLFWFYWHDSFVGLIPMEYFLSWSNSCRQQRMLDVWCGSLVTFRSENPTSLKTRSVPRPSAGRW